MDSTLLAPVGDSDDLGGLVIGVAEGFWRGRRLQTLPIELSPIAVQWLVLSSWGGFPPVLYALCFMGLSGGACPD